MSEQAGSASREPASQAPRRGLLDPRLAAIGMFGGVRSGPLLVLWAGYRQRDAHALSLGAIIPISIAGAITFGAAGKVRLVDGVALAIGAVAGARVGAGLLARIEERPLKLAFGIFLVAVSALMVVRR